MARNDKRSVVKHRTRESSKGSKPKGGFRVGATNIPNGAYIGHAKKHKEELIHKAKVKKAYYKMLQREQGAHPQEPSEEASAPKDESVEKPLRAKPKKKLPYFYTPPKTPKKEEIRPQRTREQALEDREARRELWRRKSPSRLGSKRGQPDLGARMQVMLDKIQRSK